MNDITYSNPDFNTNLVCNLTKCLFNSANYKKDNEFEHFCMFKYIRINANGKCAFVKVKESKE